MSLGGQLRALYPDTLILVPDKAQATNNPTSWSAKKRAPISPTNWSAVK
jgi:hypothetical protein